MKLYIIFLVFLACMYINYLGTPTHEGFDAIGNTVNTVGIIIYVVCGLIIVFGIINSLFVETPQSYKNL
jgi:hypothetical protein